MKSSYERVLLGALVAAMSAAALGYTVGDPPTMPAPVWKLPVGEGLGLHLLTFTDMDDDDGTPVADTAFIDCVTVIEPGGRSVVMCAQEWDEWAPSRPGLYQLLVRLDDLGAYADDPAVVYLFTLEVSGAAGCTSCGGCGRGRSGQRARWIPACPSASAWAAARTANRSDAAYRGRAHSRSGDRRRCSTTWRTAADVEVIRSRDRADPDAATTCGHCHHRRLQYHVRLFAHQRTSATWTRAFIRLAPAMSSRSG